MEWPETISILLGAGADIDAVDDFGLTPIFYAAMLFLPEPFNILGENQCELRNFTSRYAGKPQSSLEYLVRCWPSRVSKYKAEAIFDAAVRLLAKRRRMLEVLVRTSLHSKATQRLRLSSETVLDHKASLAISMLREKIDVPGSLVTVSLSSSSNSTVYHIRGLTLRQAHVLWDHGFRDVDEFDSVGLSALMKCGTSSFLTDYCTTEVVKFAAWLVEKGADLHCQQRHAFQERIVKHRCYPGNWLEICKTNRTSSATALHYLASHLGAYATKSWQLLGNINALSGKARRLVRTVLTDDLPDCCTCACSVGGCRAYTMAVKRYITVGGGYDLTRLYMTQAIAQELNVDQLSLAWLRCEMVRFCTFEKMELRHTCCMMGYFGEFNDEVISEPDDEEKREIMEEQAEQLDKLDILLVEFEDAYAALGLPFSEFLGGYWQDRIREFLREEVPIDHTALENMGVKLRRTGSSSSWSEDEDEDGEDEDEDEEDEEGKEGDGDGERQVE